MIQQMNKKLIIGIVIIIVIVIIVVYYMGVTNVSGKFDYKPGMDTWGNDMNHVNAQFVATGKTTINDAMHFALGRNDVIGFVVLNSGEVLFKSALAENITPCINNLCVNPGAGLYLKR